MTPASVFARDWSALLPSLPHAPPLEALGVNDGDEVLVVVAHPDDETLGFGGTIASLAHQGVRVDVVSLTSGEAALDHVNRYVPGLAARRREEFSAACDALGVRSCRVLGHPDGGLRDAQAVVDRAVERLVRDRGPAHLVTVWWGDPHADHRAVGQAVVRAGQVIGCPVSGFPIWAQHWSDPQTATQEGRFHVITNGACASRQRLNAVGCYATQTEPLTPDLAAILPASLVHWTPELMVPWTAEPAVRP